MKRPKLSIIGAGNVGTQLALAFYAAGYSIIEVCSRSEARAIPLADTLNARFVKDVSLLENNADVYLFCISEEDLKRLPKLDHLQGKLLCHTSGSTSMDVLSGLTTSYGVFYPLQTFSLAESINLVGIPILIEAKKPDELATLNEMAKNISGDARVTTGPERLIIHLSAVIACNFTNYLYWRAEELLNRHGLAFELLHPLITETARKATHMSPKLAQTGPAVRGDLDILQRHKELLASDPEILKIYTRISKELMLAYPASGISLQDIPEKKLKGKKLHE